MSWRTTAVLFALLVLLGGYVFWQSQQEPVVEPAPTPDPGAISESVRLIADVTVENVRRLDIRRAEDDTAVSFSRDDRGEWLQTVPTIRQLITPTMNSHAGSLATVTSRRILSPDANPLSAYGLEHPAYEIDLALTRDGEAISRFTFFVGNKIPTGDGIYIQKQGDPRVFIVPGHIFDNLTHLIDNPPLPEPTLEIPALIPFEPTSEAEEEATPEPPSD